MNTILSLNLSLGIMLVLVGIMVYCMYKTIEQVPKIFKVIKEAKQSQKEMQDFLNNLQPYKKDLDKKYKCPGDTMICQTGYACDACPYNEDMYPPIVSDLKLSGRDMKTFVDQLEEEELEDK